MPTARTHPGAEGRLFPTRTWDHGWTLSLQADAAGYACTPRVRLDHLEDYVSVEVAITGPFRGPVDITTLDLPDGVARKFPQLEPDDFCTIGHELTWEDVAAMETAILLAGNRPNAGVPRGTIGWTGERVFHGTSRTFAEDILAYGVSMEASGLGYLGQGFYVADEESLARSNYAGFSDDEDGGVVLAMEIAEGARILDLRNVVDADQWSRSGLLDQLHMPDFARRARLAGIDGVYDRSVGGLAIYNPKVLENVWLVPAPGNPQDQGPDI